MQTFQVEVHCVACAFVERIYVEPMDYVHWGKGLHAQDAFPYLTEDERDALITSMCLDCLEEVYRDAREEEDEEEDYIDPDELDFDFLNQSDDPEYQSDWYVDRDCD